MATLNQYQIAFGEKQFILTTEHGHLFMEEIERVVEEKYLALKEKMSKNEKPMIELDKIEGDLWFH